MRILNQLARAADKYGDWKRLELFDGSSATAGVHLAVMVEPFLGYILDGRKTIESRFSKPLIAPYRRIAVGDIVLLKAGCIVACFRAGSVEFIELDDEERRRIVRDHSGTICADEAFWDARVDKRYCTLIGIEDVRQLTSLKVDKRDRRGWLVLREAPRPTGPEQLQLAIASSGDYANPGDPLQEQE